MKEELLCIFKCTGHVHMFKKALWKTAFSWLCLKVLLSVLSPSFSSRTGVGHSLDRRDHDLKEWYKDEREEKARLPKEKPFGDHWKYPQVVTLSHSPCPVLLVINLATTSGWLIWKIFHLLLQEDAEQEKIRRGIGGEVTCEGWNGMGNILLPSFTPSAT